MSTATLEPTTELRTKPAEPAISTLPCPVTLTEKAASEVRRAIEDYRSSGDAPSEQLYLRLRVQGGGCSGFQNKLDLDPTFNEKLDHLWEVQGVPLVVDKRSLLYLEGATVDFIDDLNKRGFHISNPQAKGTCGCGSSYAM